jgi:hypothetical protein
VIRRKHVQRVAAAGEDLSEVADRRRRNRHRRRGMSELQRWSPGPAGSHEQEGQRRGRPACGRPNQQIVTGVTAAAGS